MEQVVVPGGARSKVELRPSPGSSGIWKQLQMGVTKLQCNFCPYQSGDRYNMKRHTKRRHSGDKSIQEINNLACSSHQNSMFI